MLDINKRLVRAPLFNSSAPNRSTAIINGEFSGILHWNDVRYSNMYDLYQTLLANFWKPTDINMQEDVKQWDSLPPFVQNIFLRVNAQLAGLDSLQTPTIMELLPYLTDSSMRAIIAVIAQQEAVHNDSYSMIMNTLLPLSTQKEYFKQAKEDDVILQRNLPIIEAYEEFIANPTPQNLLRFLVNGVCLEGVHFYTGFAFFYWLAYMRYMLKTSTMISYIQKDEMQHAYFLTMIIRSLLAEVPELNTEENRAYIRDRVESAVTLEKEWAHHLLGEINNVDLSEYKLGRGVDLKEFGLYMEYLANKRMRQMGLPNIYPDIDNPMPWIHVFSDEMISNTKTDFFESKDRNYTMVSESNGFDEL